MQAPLGDVDHNSELYNAFLAQEEARLFDMAVAQSVADAEAEAAALSHQAKIYGESIRFEEQRRERVQGVAAIVARGFSCTAPTHLHARRGAFN